jgi:hypothetical protein
MAIVSQTGPTIAEGPANLRVLRQNPPVGLAPPRAMDKATQRGPIKGTQHPQALYLSPRREVSFLPLRVGWHLAIRVFLIGITWESHLKPPGPDLIGGGGISPCLVLCRGIYPSRLSPTNGDLGSTQILTRHYDAKFQTVS